jgi:phosphoglycerate kinase
MLDKLLENPEHPYLAILGGSKISDKINVIEKLINIVDGFIIGGAMAYTFLKAKGTIVGKSLVEQDKLNYAREMMTRMETRGKTLLLPVDHIVAGGISATTGEQTATDVIPDDKMGLDIGTKTIQQYVAAIKSAKTIFWNGPMGVFETPAFQNGTFAVAKALSENTGMRIVGGGDSAAAAEASGCADKMTHISTGGGASLEYLQGDRLPGLEVLRQKARPQVI